jgi:hypothetical protein
VSRLRPDPERIVASVCIVTYKGDTVKLVFAEADAPLEMLELFASLRVRGTCIHGLIVEIALAAPYFAAEIMPSLAGHSLIHFADNQAANAAAIKGRPHRLRWRASSAHSTSSGCA